MVVVAALIAGGFYYFRSRPAAPLTEKDTVVLADFDNKTGDAVFDDALKQALAVQLGQSPFLNILSDRKVEETLHLMGRTSNERVTRDIARELCIRTGSKAFLFGSISNLGGQFVIGVDAIGCSSGSKCVALPRLVPFRSCSRPGSNSRWPAGSTSTTPWPSSRSARASAWIAAAVRDGLALGRGACPAGWNGWTSASRSASIVDYAHSPASLQTVLDLLAPVAAARGGGVIAVFGSAGERDVAKRPLMGRIAGERAGSSSSPTRIRAARTARRSSTRSRRRRGGRRAARPRPAASSPTGGRPSRPPSSGPAGRYGAARRQGPRAVDHRAGWPVAVG